MDSLSTSYPSGVLLPASFPFSSPPFLRSCLCVGGRGPCPEASSSPPLAECPPGRCWQSAAVQEAALESLSSGSPLQFCVCSSASSSLRSPFTCLLGALAFSDAFCPAFFPDVFCFGPCCLPQLLPLSVPSISWLYFCLFVTVVLWGYCLLPFFPPIPACARQYPMWPPEPLLPRSLPRLA